jgi:hypothetical protein
LLNFDTHKNYVKVLFAALVVLVFAGQVSSASHAADLEHDFFTEILECGLCNHILSKDDLTTDDPILIERAYSYSQVLYSNDYQAFAFRRISEHQNPRAPPYI